MKIERVVVRGLRALRERDDRWTDPDGRIHASVCLRGLNGSGKTTYLEALAQLWQWFRRCTKRGAFVSPSPEAWITRAELIAVRFSELPGPRSTMWIAWGRAPALRELAEKEDEVPLVVDEEGIRWEPGLLEWWNQAFARAETGDDPVPNFVFIEAETKFVPKLRPNELTDGPPAPAYVPVSRQAPTMRGANHLEGIMRTLFLARPERWRVLQAEFRRLRPNLRLLDTFDVASQRPLFELTDGTRLTVDLLSAGERSVLVNMCMVLRWLAPGGVVLLDEPELHQHVSLMRGSVAVLEALVTSDEFRGQLVVASHAPEVWDHFRAVGAIRDLQA